MGLGTSYDCWQGSYTRFKYWRDTIADVSGIDIDWDAVTSANLEGDWHTDPEDVLTVLIAHSDCEGYIQSKYTEPLATRLEGLLPLLEDNSWAAEKTIQFIEGLRRAHSAWDDVEFR